MARSSGVGPVSVGSIRGSGAGVLLGCRLAPSIAPPRTMWSVVDLTSRANVLLLDAANFQRYRNGNEYRYIGGQALRSPLRIEVPYAAT